MKSLYIIILVEMSELPIVKNFLYTLSMIQRVTVVILVKGLTTHHYSQVIHHNTHVTKGHL
jgi:hypothetical protein